MDLKERLRILKEKEQQIKERILLLNTKKNILKKKLEKLSEGFINFNSKE